jgi:hypothetical protein
MFRKAKFKNFLPQFSGSRHLSGYLSEICQLAGVAALAVFSFFLLVQAGCPNPAVTQGYLGNLGTDAGNCNATPLPPLCAFGSLTVNQNSPLQSINRLNLTQLPTTNNFQLFQNPCAIDQNTWASGGNTGIQAGAGTFRMRHGPFLIGMARTGPVATVAQFNFNQNASLPNLTADNRMTFFFSASETNGTGNDYFNVSTNVVNSETCVITYTPRNGHLGSIQDYNLTGNVFHDVFYQNLTPALAFTNSLVTIGTSVYLSIDGGAVNEYKFGSTVHGHSFQFFANRYAPLGPATMVLYAVNAGDSGISFQLQQSPSDPFVFTATAPYTGFLRLAPISTNDPAPDKGDNWTQASYFMPEDACNGADTSRSGNFIPPCAVQGSLISPCAIENSSCALVPTQPNWWKTAQVHAISPTGMSFYMLLPATWGQLFSQLAVKTIGLNWMNTAGTTQFPSSQALSDILPAIAIGNYTAATGYYTDFFQQLNPSGLPPYTDGSDFATNFFCVQFDMFMANNLRSDYTAFQGTRTLQAYNPAPVNNIATFTAHRLYIPVQANISTTANSVSWTYTPSIAVPPPPGPFNSLFCFPFWKYLNVGTLQNFIFNDTIKGTLYTAVSNNGVVTFTERGIPSWYGPTSHFIPPTLTFDPTQMSALATALTQIQQEVVPLPYFPENQLDPAYNAGKTCFMLAKTALYIAYYMHLNGSTNAAIIAQTQPFIDNAKSCLTAYLLGRTPGSSFFIADRSSAGICVNGAGGDGTWAQGPNLEQFIDSGVDFGNYIYNDHHFFAGYFLLASAIVTEWEMKYTPLNLWINLPVKGADKQDYKIRDMVDFLWRDTHNPFTNDISQPVYDPDLPYDRYGFPWEGHSIANGLQYQPNSLGRNQESISEDFNCWLGMNAFASLVLQTTLTPTETTRYQAVYDFSLMHMQLDATSGIQWYKNPTYWIGQNLFQTNPTSTAPAIYIGQFTQATVTNGEINDQSAQNQTFF